MLPFLYAPFLPRSALKPSHPRCSLQPSHPRCKLQTSHPRCTLQPNHPQCTLRSCYGHPSSLDLHLSLHFLYFLIFVWFSLESSRPPFISYPLLPSFHFSLPFLYACFSLSPLDVRYGLPTLDVHCSLPTLDAHPYLTLVSNSSSYTIALPPSIYTSNSPPSVYTVHLGHTPLDALYIVTWVCPPSMTCLLAGVLILTTSTSQRYQPG